MEYLENEMELLDSYIIKFLMFRNQWLGKRHPLIRSLRNYECLQHAVILIWMLLETKWEYISIS